MEGPSVGNPHRKAMQAKKWAILVVAIVVCGGIAATLIIVSSEKTVSGFVLDAKGDPITGATVTGGSAKANTGSDGRFSINVLDLGQVVMMASAGGHWSQKKMLGQGDGPLLNFTLIDNVYSQIPLEAIFLGLKSNTTINGTIEISNHALGSQRSIEVDDLASDGMMTFRINFDNQETNSGTSIDVWTFHSFYNASSFIEMASVTVSGVYWSDPGECENCYVIGWDGESNSNMALAVPDYLSPDTTQGVEAHQLENGVGRTVVNSPLSSYQLPLSLGADVSVDILGKSFNCTLPVIFDRVSNGAAYASVVLYIQGGSTQSIALKILDEGGHILHIWEA